MSTGPEETLVQEMTKKLHIDDEYAVLMETNRNECESWYYFIRRKGNEEALKHLQEQIEKHLNIR